MALAGHALMPLISPTSASGSWNAGSSLSGDLSLKSLHPTRPLPSGCCSQDTDRIRSRQHILEPRFLLYCLILYKFTIAKRAQALKRHVLGSRRAGGRRALCEPSPAGGSRGIPLAVPEERPALTCGPLSVLSLSRAGAWARCPRSGSSRDRTRPAPRIPAL